MSLISVLLDPGMAHGLPHCRAKAGRMNGILLDDCHKPYQGMGTDRAVPQMGPSVHSLGIQELIGVT